MVTVTGIKGRIRKQYRQLLVNEIADTVETKQDLEQELRHLPAAPAD
jgi:hypothetical protein